MLVVTDTLT